MKRSPMRMLLAAGFAALAATTASAQDNKLRLLTWADYVPADVVAQFKKETGIDVEVTLSNNEEMISKLRATGGAGFDLAQPSQDRIAGPQAEFGIYKPMDLGKIKTELFIPSMLDATKKNTTLAGKVYGLPHIWGTDGLVVNTKAAKINDYASVQVLNGQVVAVLGHHNGSGGNMVQDFSRTYSLTSVREIVFDGH